MASRRACRALGALNRTPSPLQRPSFLLGRAGILERFGPAKAAVALFRAHSSASSSPDVHSSVDPSEVSHFNALASSWWDPHGPSRLLHLMNQLRHPFIAKCLSSQASGPPAHRLRYLDVGCGGGIFAESAARLPTTQSVLGIDPTPEVFAIAESHKRQDPLLMEEGRLRYENISVERLPLPAKPEDGFDIVTCFEVIEHVSQPAQFLQNLMPHVKPGGWIVLSTIARTWTSWATTVVAAEEIIRMVPKGTHDWNKYINEDELRNWFVKQPEWESPRAMGVVYVPGFGWKEVRGSENWGNYFFAVRRKEE